VRPVGEDHRRDERAPVTGTLRLMVNSGAGYVLASGEIVDLAAGGCGVRVGQRELAADLTGRIELVVAGQRLSLPVVTRWVRTEPDGTLIVGCRFFRTELERTTRDTSAASGELRERDRSPGSRSVEELELAAG